MSFRGGIGDLEVAAAAIAVVAAGIAIAAAGAAGFDLSSSAQPESGPGDCFAVASVGMCVPAPWPGVSMYAPAAPGVPVPAP